jgi:hypothetical protein
MVVNQPGQGDEVAAGQRQERYVRRDFLQQQAGALDQVQEKAFHHFSSSSNYCLGGKCLGNEISK